MVSKKQKNDYVMKGTVENQKEQTGVRQKMEDKKRSKKMEKITQTTL